jgi:transcriptional regulator with XRE-family HTH domain
MEKHPLNQTQFTSEKWAAELGEQIRTLRLQRNITQDTLAEQAGISAVALKNLESGKGANISTLIKTLRVLERADWLRTLAPNVTISPLQLLKTKTPRSRASSQRKALTHG